jgi:hypothetical protein
VLEFLGKHIVDVYIILLLGLQASMIFPALNWWPHPIRWFSSLPRTDKISMLLVLFTFVLAFATLRLWLATRDLVVDAEDTAERQLRAYVYIGSADTNMKTNPDGTSTFTYTPAIKVFGMTPAAWVSPSWDLQIFPAWSPGKFPKLPLSVTRIDLVAVPSQNPYPLETKSLVLQATDIASLQEKSTMIVAFGRVTYNDVFGKPRWTDFCTTLDWQEANSNKAETCPEHNDADWSGHPPPLVIPLTIVITPALPKN